MVTDERPELVCEHVLLNPSDLRLWFTGRGLSRYWVCSECAQRHPEAPAWRAIDDARWAERAGDSYCGGAVGQPEVLTRATDLAFAHADVALSLDAEVIDFLPCADDAAGCWFLLADGGLLRVDLSSGRVTRALHPAELGFAVGAGCGLCLSPVGDYGAIFEASGSHGAVVDLRDGRVVRRLDAWRDNPWESEDGPTKRQLAIRDYYWDGPACWVDDRTVALWGWGSDDEWLLPAALLVDARDGKQLRWFAGPRVRPSSAWPPRALADSLVFDGYLFAVDDEAGTTVWDVATGERVCADATLRPTRYHRGMRAFLTRTVDAVRLSRLMG